METKCQIKAINGCVITIAQGNAGCCGVPVVANACASCCTRGYRCNAIRHSLRPLCFVRVVRWKTRAQWAARTRTCASQWRPSRLKI